MNNRFFPLLLLLALSVAGCGGDRAQGAAAQAEPSDIAACDLLSKADAETILGTAVSEPTPREIAGMSGERATSCIFAGDGGTLMLRAWHPYGGTESNGAELAARLRSERADQAVAESDVELRKLTESATITTYDALGIPAALEDTRTGLGGVTLHVVKPSAKAYVAISADTPERAHMAAERILARLP